MEVLIYIIMKNTTLTPIKPNTEDDNEYLPPLLCRYVSQSSEDFSPSNLLEQLKSGNPFEENKQKNVEFGIFRLRGEGKTINAITYLANPAIHTVSDLKEEYVGVIDPLYTYGRGGNITGFLDLLSIKYKRDFERIQTAFGFGKDLIVILTPILEVTTNFRFHYSVGGLKDAVVPCKNIVKVAKLGDLMDEPNKYEWNFITNQCVELPAVRIKNVATNDLGNYLPVLNQWIIEGAGYYQLPRQELGYDQCPYNNPIMEKNVPCTTTTNASSSYNMEDTNGGRKTRKVLKKNRKTRRSKKLRK